jgi:[ribosomal protein S18]-alanine N-acetyltransferase
VKFTFKKRAEEDAHQIASWHYPPPYDFYDMDQDPEDLAELLDPQTWQEPNYSVFNEENELVGFFDFKPDGQTVEVGLGLRPDLTGRGLGRAFITAGLTFGQELFSVEVWSLRVATFNTRAIRLYEHAGFTRLNTFLQHTNGGEYEFLRMVRPI